MHKNKTVSYLRVSTNGQDLEKNKADILTFANDRKFGHVRFIEEKISGKKNWKERKIKQIIDDLGAGDRLIVPELSRLGRSMLEIMEILSVAKEKEICIYALKGNWELIGSDTISGNSASVQVSDTSSIPTGTRFILVQLNSYSYESTYQDVYSCNILLIKDLIDTGYHSVYNTTNASSATDYKGLKASISGSTLTCVTLNLNVGGGRTLYLSGTVKYFK